MKYEEMSKFEVNSAVAKIEFPEYKQIITADNLDGVSSTVIMSKPISETGSERHYLDYCSCPDSAWPIIFENEINIEFLDGGYVDVSVETDFGTFSTDDTYPKERLFEAAMICFLKMKKAESNQ